MRRYLAAGVVNTLVGLSAFPLLSIALAPLKLHYLGVLALAYACGVAFSFLLTKNYVFQTRGIRLNEVWKFTSFHLLYFIINLAVLPFLVEILKIKPVIGQTGFSVFAMFSGYFWHSRITFWTQRSEERIP